MEGFEVVNKQARYPLVSQEYQHDFTFTDERLGDRFRATTN
jgi:hypothetical protein